MVSSTQGKAKHVSFQPAASVPPVSQPLVTQPAQPTQTAFADAMARWKLNMVVAINSCPSLEDNPLPPPLGRPGDGPVAAAAAPQGALELMSAQAVRDQPGKHFKPVLSKHVPDHLKQRIWVDKYINFQYLIESDPTEEVVYHFVPTNTNDSGLTLQPVRPKVKLDGWVAWNKAMHMFMEIYCMKYPNHCMELL